MCDVALLCRCDFVVSVLLLSVLLLLDLRDDAVVTADVVVCCVVTGVTVTAAGDGDTPFEITSSCVLGGRAVGRRQERRWLQVMLIHRNLNSCFMKIDTY